VRALSYRYPAWDRGIEDIDLELARGSLTVVTGRIGAGKTTLLRVVLGLLPADSGEIRWNGQLIQTAGEFMIPPRVAFTPQVPRLFSESLRDNILMGIEDRDGRLARPVRAAVIEPALAELEHGMETQVWPRGIKLSGGQLQRAAAARMLVREPELLVMDDLSSALDVETEQLLWKNVLDLRDVTCLAISHRREVLQRADQVILLKDGRVDARGRLSELLSESAEMRALWERDIGAETGIG